MAEASGWDELTRFEQRLLIKLFGGGTVRKENPAVVDELRARGLVDENKSSRCQDCSFSRWRCAASKRTRLCGSVSRRSRHSWCAG